MFTDFYRFVGLPWGTSTLKNCHPEDSERSGSGRIEFSSNYHIKNVVLFEGNSILPLPERLDPKTDPGTGDPAAQAPAIIAIMAFQGHG